MSDYDVQDSHDKLDGYPSPSQAVQVFGHNKQARFLASAYSSGRMHHAFLFDGAPGIGKASLAFVFARHIIANPDYVTAPVELDGHATQDLVRQIAMGAHPQVLHLTRPLDPKTGKHKTQLTVEETRKISHFLSHTVAGNGYRIVIVDPVNDMNANAANALLKNLEEPTARTVFILISQSSGRLLPTIRSRCLSVRFETPDEQTVLDALVHLGAGDRLSQDTLRQIASRAGGSVRAAAILAEGGGLEILQAADEVVSAPVFNPTLALKIGEAVSQRDAEPLFHLLVDDLLTRLANYARSAATNSNADAARLAQVQRDAASHVAECLKFNLDRKPLIMQLLLTTQTP